MRVLERHELAELKTPSYFSLLPTPCPLMATQNLMSDIRALLSSIANCVSSSMPLCRASFLAPSSPRFIIDQQSPTMVLRVDTCLPPPATNVHYSTFLEPGIDGVQGAVYESSPPRQKIDTGRFNVLARHLRPSVLGKPLFDIILFLNLVLDLSRLWSRRHSPNILKTSQDTKPYSCLILVYHSADHLCTDTISTLTENILFPISSI